MKRLPGINFLGMGLIGLFACTPGSRGSVAGTYVQEGVPVSPMTFRLTLKEDKTFELRGQGRFDGTYAVEGSLLRLTFSPVQFTTSPTSNQTPNPMSVTIKGDVIHMPEGLPNLPASRFKKR